MKVLVCFKSVYDDCAIRVNHDKTLGYSAVPHIVSMYDLNAIEAAVRFKETSASHSVVALSVGDTKINESSLNVTTAARGVQETYFVMDDALEDAETYQTATVLASAIEKIGGVDLIICGDGAADTYAHSVGIQLGEIMGIPNVNAVLEFHEEEGKIRATRELDDSVEVVELSTPCVLSVLSDAAQPRIPNAIAIMTAGRKPFFEWTLEDIDAQVPGRCYEIVETKVASPAPRKMIHSEGSDEGIDEFIQRVHNYLITEGA